MLFFIILTLGLGAIAADTVHYYHLKKRKPGRHLLFAFWAAATDAIPLLVLVQNAVLRDNDTPVMYVMMWLFWIWMLNVLPRLCYYFFAVLRLRRLGLAAGLCVAVLFIWGATAGRTTIRVSRTEVCSPRIPAGFDGYRIVQLSDIHLGTIVRPEKELARIADSVNSLHPDLVVFSGDLVNVRYTELDPQAVRLLQRLEAPVVSVTGNHDVGAYIKDTVSLPREVSLARVIERQRAMGWNVLEDTTVYLHRGGDSIALTGLSYDPGIRQRRHDRTLPPANLATAYRGVPDSLFDITVVHLPQLWNQLREIGRGDLTLSGHVHSMQLKIRLFGRSWSPAAWLYKRWSGRYDEGPHTLYINDGTGYVAYPMRLGAYPEITLFTLKRCA